MTNEKNNQKSNRVSPAVRRRDGTAKVTGGAKFAADYCFPGQLHGVMIYLPVTHAEIHRTDYTALRGAPGLAAICDATDVPGAQEIGIVRCDQPVFNQHKVVARGDSPAMLVGADRRRLLKLREKVRVDYTALPVVSDPVKALDADAPLVHPSNKGNLLVHHVLRKGDAEKGFAMADRVVEQTYRTPFVEHAYLETECVTALRDGGGIEIIGSIQNPFTTRRLVAAVLGRPLAAVRVRQAVLGGSFGGKDDIMNLLAARAAIAALKTGKPVRIALDRHESVTTSYKRHPYVMHYRVGVKTNGKITAMQIDIVADAGAYASTTPFVTWRSLVQATGPYEIEHISTDVRAVYTNNPYAGAMRGFGSPQVIFAQESLMDEIALLLDMEPDDIRRVNGFRNGSVTATGQKLGGHDVNLVPVLDAACRQTRFSEQRRENLGQPPPPKDWNRRGHQPPHFIPADRCLRKGIGLAVSFRGCSLGAEGMDAAAAYLLLQPDGSAHLAAGLTENGQGLTTTFCIIAADVLGISPGDIFYTDPDTGVIADSGPTVASRSTLMGGGAVRAAAKTLRRRLEDFMVVDRQLPPRDQCRFHFEDHRVTAVFERDGREETETVAFERLCRGAYDRGIDLAATGWYKAPPTSWDHTVGQGRAYFTYVYGCQVAEVTVNIVTGEVFVDQVTAVHDAGRIINRLGAEGQVYGGVTQGAGYGLMEEITCRDGVIRETNLDRYLIPTAADIGEIVPLFIRGKDSVGPGGAKSLGEPAMELTAAAIANAVRNALGTRYYSLPLNLEEIRLQEKLRETN